jgi:hypothetical protein
LETTIQWMLEIMRFFSAAPGALAKGFVLPFWWVLLFWLATFCFFYTYKPRYKYIAQLSLLGSLILLMLQRQRELYVQQVTYYQNDRVLLLRNGNAALAFGPKPKEKCAFLLPALEIYHNCEIRYQQVKKGTTKVRLKYIAVQISNQKSYQIDIQAQKQTDKIKVF